jgi:ribosomal protein S18 acetylase RimI-like enzyme
MVADRVASALAEDWSRMLAAHPQGWSRREPDGLAARSGVPLPTLNGVWAHGADPRPTMIGQLLDELAPMGLPYCLQVRPDAAAALGEVARGRGMELAEEDIPLMVLDGRPRTGDLPAELSIRALAPGEVDVHTRLLAAGFEAPEEHFVRLMAPEMVGVEGMRCYVGEVDGRAVATGLGFTVDDHVGIFNVATSPEARRRGYGAALTARATEDGLAAGAGWAWLQSSPSGYRVYERLGFRQVERWDVWLATFDPSSSGG